MAKGAGGKAAKRSKRAARDRDRGAARLEKALAAGLRRESKAASRLQVAQLEVAVLRMALAELVGGETAPTGAVAAADEAPTPAPVTPTKRAPATRARRPRPTPPAPADR